MLQQLSNFQQRFLLGVASVIALSVLLLYSHQPGYEYFFAAAIAGAQALALIEFYALCEIKGVNPLKRIGIMYSIVYIFLRQSVLHTQILDVLQCLLFFMLTVHCFIAHFHSCKNSIIDISCTLFGILYITLPIGFILDINNPLVTLRDYSSSIWIVYLLLATKMTDICAYFTGKQCGKRPLAPIISPKKTVEGAIGGFVGSMLATVAFVVVLNHSGYFAQAHICGYSMLILGIVIAIGAQIGDLAESLLKRDADTKDSSKLPGFGGMLDIVDSLIFTTPLLYLWLKVQGIT